MNTRRLVLPSLALTLTAGAASAQSIEANITPPVVDRWMYPFGSEAGTRASVPVFGSQNACGPDDRFDDRDAEMLVTFSTESVVPAGWPAGAYRVAAAAIFIRVSDATSFVYDPTLDAIETYLARGDETVPCSPDAAYTPDLDPGRPLEVFAVAFRNGFTSATYTESSPFKPGMAFVPPWINVRHAYPVGFDSTGQAVDASSPIKSRSLLHPLALGTSSTATPGELVPEGTEFTFDLPVSAPGTREYLQHGLASGRLALLLTSLAEAQQQVTGSYANIYTREANPLIFPNAAAPRLVVSLFLCAADVNGDADLNPDDLGDYINTYFAVPPGPGADFNRDGAIDPDDLGDYINAYFSGCP
ncbi:MAG: hypothetical protein AB7K52_08595 [Phycisphaerales bacterium]